MKIPGVVLEGILSQVPLERILHKQNDPAPQKRSRPVQLGFTVV